MRRSRHARSTHLRPFRGLLQHLSPAAPPSKSTSADFERNRLSLRGRWRVCKQRSCGQRIAPTIGGCRLFRPSRKISRTAFCDVLNTICHSSTEPQRETEPAMSELNAQLHLEAWIEVVTQAVGEQIDAVSRHSTEPYSCPRASGGPLHFCPVALAGWWASPYLGRKGAIPRERDWTRGRRRG